MNFSFAVGAVFTLVMVVGCGGGAGSDMGTVTGAVTLDGKPVGNATVTFFPTEGRSSTGFTKADGKYELFQTRDRVGAAIGKHKVTVTQEKASDLEAGVEKVDLPKKYADQKTTDLDKSVEAGSNEINLELKSK